jgi:hypothetical protein
VLPCAAPNGLSLFFLRRLGRTQPSEQTLESASGQNRTYWFFGALRARNAGAMGAGGAGPLYVAVTLAEIAGVGWPI